MPDNNSLAQKAQNLVADLHVKYFARDCISVEQLYDDVDRLSDLVVRLAGELDRLRVERPGYIPRTPLFPKKKTKKKR